MPAQLSLFSADNRDPALDDLDGLLAGPAQIVQRASGARVSVVLPRPDGWRQQALLAGLARLGLDGEVVPAASAVRSAALAVRTPFSELLLPLAQRWTRGASKHPPPALTLDGARLRWWCLAGGWPDDAGWMLRLDPAAEAGWTGVAAALSRAGLHCSVVGRRANGPGCRIMGARRLQRLAELVGAPPPAAPPDDWPPGGAAPPTAPTHPIGTS